MLQKQTHVEEQLARFSTAYACLKSMMQESGLMSEADYRVSGLLREMQEHIADIPGYMDREGASLYTKLEHLQRILVEQEEALLLLLERLRADQH
jgi:hypothetical protein